MQAERSPRRRTFAGRFFQKHLFVPAEHGAWVFLFCPLAIGLAAGKSFEPASLALVAAALAAFLVRQPVTVVVKAYSGRRPRAELFPAAAWAGIYSLLAAGSFAALAAAGFGFIGWLAVPALPVLAWHLWLVSRRAERNAAALEMVACGALALAAPAAAWVGKGAYDPSGWLLWGLCWLQSSVMIAYTFLRLAQRRLETLPDRAGLLRMGLRTNLYSSTALLVCAGLAFIRLVPPLVPLAFLILSLESIWGTLHPAFKARPAAIGFRQLLVSFAFTLVFVLAWN